MLPTMGASSNNFSGSSQILDVPVQPPARLARKWWGEPDVWGKVIYEGPFGGGDLHRKWKVESGLGEWDVRFEQDV